MIGFLLFILALTLTGYLVLSQPHFGKAPSGKRLERILKSPHYKNGRFDNLNATPQLAEDTSMPEVMFRFLFGKTPDKTPSKAFHFQKTDLHQSSVRSKMLLSGWDTLPISCKLKEKKSWLIPY